MGHLSSAYIEGQTRAGYAGSSPQDDARRFRAAQRHSRRVRLLRIGIPAAAALSALLGTGILLFNPLKALNKLPVDLGGLVIAGSKITMEQPRLAGYTKDQRPYEVSARAASQDITKPQLMELRDLNAKIELQDRTTVKMSAKAGLYDTKADVLRISPDIVLTSSKGYEGYLSEAVIDVKTGNVVSEQPVTLKMVGGTLSAQRMEIANAGEIVRFEGGVVMQLDPSKVPSPATAENAAQ